METTQLLLLADTLIAHCQRAVDEVQRTAARPDDDFEAQFSDANRTYVALWEQLDAAHGQLASAGRDVSAFDALCSGESPDRSAVVVIDLDDRVHVRTVETIDVNTNKTVTRHEYRQAAMVQDQFGTQVLERAYRFNEHGLQVAAAASTALKEAMPEIDWAALTRAAAAPPPDLLAPSRSSLVAAFAAVVLVLVVLYFVLR